MIRPSRSRLPGGTLLSLCSLRRYSPKLHHAPLGLPRASFGSEPQGRRQPSRKRNLLRVSASAARAWFLHCAAAIAVAPPAVAVRLLARAPATFGANVHLGADAPATWLGRCLARWAIPSPMPGSQIRWAAHG